MRVIAISLSLITVLMVSLTMAGGLKAAHDQGFFMSHLYWGYATMGVLLLTLTLFLMFIFKMHGIIHDLIRKLDQSS